MKSILVVLGLHPFQLQYSQESLAAIMVLASFGIHIELFIQQQSLYLLDSSTGCNQFQDQAFKSPQSLLKSFELYDIETIWIDQCMASHSIVKSSALTVKAAQLDADLIKKFDHVLYF